MQFRLPWCSPGHTRVNKGSRLIIRAMYYLSTRGGLRIGRKEKVKDDGNGQRGRACTHPSFAPVVRKNLGEGGRGDTKRYIADLHAVADACLHPPPGTCLHHMHALFLRHSVHLHGANNHTITSMTTKYTMAPYITPGA